MGMMLDTNVLIRFEKSGKAVDVSAWSVSETVYISSVTASEMLVGVHRANTEERRTRRAAFVEAIFTTTPIVDFTLASARIHAIIAADLMAKGLPIGTHDLLIAASALQRNFSILTTNVAEFSRVPGLRVIPYSE